MLKNSFLPSMNDTHKEWKWLFGNFAITAFVSYLFMDMHWNQNTQRVLFASKGKCVNESFIVAW